MKLNKIVDERTREWAERAKRISERATTIENRRDDDVTLRRKWRKSTEKRADILAVDASKSRMPARVHVDFLFQ